VATARRSLLTLALVATSCVLAACTSQPGAISTSTTTAASNSTSQPFAPPTRSLPAAPCAPPGCASPEQVQRFVALADEGPRQAYVATYRFLDAARAPSTFVFTSRGAGIGSVYTYAVTLGGTRFRAVHLASGHSPTDFFECLQHGSGPWSCYGPDPSQGNGGIEEVLSYEIALDYLRLLDPPPNASTITSRQIGRFESTCLTFTFQGPVSRTTWCVTSAGILDYFAGLNLYRPIELVSLSMVLQPGAFELPAPATRWPLWWEHVPGRNPAFEGPGFDI
jgi:hypothetical protein